MWIERLFGRLAALYGAAFGRQWSGTNLDDVKSTWAEKLGGFTAQQIGDALKSCDERPHPPNLPEFISACRQSASRAGTYREIPLPDVSKESVEKHLQSVSSAIVRPAAYDYKGWAKRLRARYLAGERLEKIQIDHAAEALGEVWTNGQCVQGKAAA